MKNSTKNKIAVFDIDGTIFRSSLAIELIDLFIGRGIFPEQAKIDIEKDYLSWFHREASYDNYIRQVVQTFLRYIPGCEYDLALEAAEEVVAGQGGRVYRYTRNLINQLAKDHFLLAISGSPSFVVSIFARKMGFDASFGQEFEVSNNRFTGKDPGRDTINNKELVAKSYIDSLNTPIDLSQSLAIGDSMADYSILNIVGNPIAFNPEKQLAETALDKGWKIVVERKNVIYDISRCRILSLQEEITV